jgi:hypothetical protein
VNRAGNPEIRYIGVATRFKAGVSGDPAGRPRKLTRILERVLDSPYPKDRKKRTYAEVLVQAVVERAINGRDYLVGLIFDRVEGKVKATCEHSGAEAAIPLTLEEIDAKIVEIVNKAQARTRARPNFGSLGDGSIGLKRALPR